MSHTHIYAEPSIYDQVLYGDQVLQSLQSSPTVAYNTPHTPLTPITPLSPHSHQQQTHSHHQQSLQYQPQPQSYHSLQQQLQSPQLQPQQPQQQLQLYSSQPQPPPQSQQLVHSISSSSSMITDDYSDGNVPLPDTGPWVLGLGLNAHLAAKTQDSMRQAGFRAYVTVAENSPEGDITLISWINRRWTGQEEKGERWEAIVLGGGLTGQSPNVRPTPEATIFFNRILNLLHKHAPTTTKFVLVQGTQDIISATKRELGIPDQELQVNKQIQLMDAIDSYQQ